MPTSPTTSVIAHLRRAALLRDGAAVGDGELLGGFIDRCDEAALAALIERHGPMVWGVCRRLLSHHDAEDAFQATFLVLVRKAVSVVPREMVGNWLYGVAHQAALQARRTAARRRAREVQVTVMPDTEAVQQDQWADVQPLLDQELSRLPDIYRAVIVLCDLEGRTRKEVARQLGVPEGTVGGQLARARAILAKRLAQRGVTLSGRALAAVLAENAASAGVPTAAVSNTIGAASNFAAGQGAATGPVSAKVAALTEGVLRAMMMSKLKAAIAVVLLLGFMVTGATVLSGRVAARANQPPAAEAPAKAPGKQAPDLMKTRDRLGRIGSAMQSYLDTYKVYPGPALFSKGGKPLLSWRVALLPYLNEGDLYRQFRLDEPWDSAHNKPLLARMPAVYCGTNAGDDTATPFQVFVGKGTLFEGPGGLGYQDIPDGTSNTVAVVEAADPVPWTKPEDLPYSATGKLPDLGGESPDVIHALFADGKVYAFKRLFDPDAFRLALTRDDGIPTPWDKLRAPNPLVGDQEKEAFTAWGKEVGGLQAGVAVVPGGERQYKPGDRVAFEVKVRNVGKKAVTITHSGVPHEHLPEITDSQGRQVRVTMPPTLDYYPPPTKRLLKPDETATLVKNEVAVEAEILETTIGPELQVSIPTIRVGPGTYKIAIGGMVQSHPKLSTGSVEFVVKPAKDIPANPKPDARKVYTPDGVIREKYDAVATRTVEFKVVTLAKPTKVKQSPAKDSPWVVGHGPEDVSLLPHPPKKFEEEQFSAILTSKVVDQMKRIGIKDVGKHFEGKTVRVSGRIRQHNYSGDDPPVTPHYDLVIEEEPDRSGGVMLRSCLPAVSLSAVAANVSATAWCTGPSCS
jgi:RNA polymerase sigma factor (sigma-70 family)